MNNLMVTNINFGAKFISRKEIAKFNDKTNQGYIPVDVSLVELNPYNENDIEAVKAVVKKWGYEDEYGSYILDDLKSLRDGYMDSRYDKVYAITSQENGYKKLDFGKIIGLGEITKITNNMSEINFLQVEPKSTYLNGSKNYINTGRTLVEYFQSKRGIKELIVKATYKAANFYEKMGFEIINVKEFIYSWKRYLKK